VGLPVDGEASGSGEPKAKAKGDELTEAGALGERKNEERPLRDMVT